jgi:hypothetical protein
MNPQLKHIKRHHLAQIAEKAKCSPKYVKYILLGVRAANSTRAKAILQVAIEMNKIIEAGYKKSDKIFKTITEND